MPPPKPPAEKKVHAGTGQKPQTIQPTPPRITKLVQLDHGNEMGPDGKLGPLEETLGFDATRPDAALQGRIDALVKKYPGSIGKVHFAVIDLDGMKYAGNHATVARSPGSMGKVMVMLAAYQLRHDLQAILDGDASIQDLRGLEVEVARRWAAAQKVGPASSRTTLRASGPTISRLDHVVRVGGDDVPIKGHTTLDLARIFKPLSQGARTLEFTSDGLTQAQLARAEQVNPRRDTVLKVEDAYQMGMLDRLKLMIGHSNNFAPDAIVRDIGFGFQHSVLLASRLFHPARGGMWLGHTYGMTWFRPPLLPVQALPGGESVNISTTAVAHATLMAAIATGKVCDQAACTEMLRMLSKDLEPGIATKSYVEEALEGRRKAGDSVHVFSKLGIVNEQKTREKYLHYSDMALLRHRTKTETTSRNYVIAFVDVDDPDYARGVIGWTVNALLSALRDEPWTPPAGDQP